MIPLRKITGVVTNNHGDALPNTAVEFLLVNRWKNAASTFDADGDYIVPGPYVAETDDTGKLDTDQWPTSRGQEERYYQVSVKADNCQPFYAPLAAGETDLDFKTFANGGIAPTPAEFSALAELLQTTIPALLARIEGLEQRLAEAEAFTDHCSVSGDNLPLWNEGTWPGGSGIMSGQGQQGDSGTEFQGDSGESFQLDGGNL